MKQKRIVFSVILAIVIFIAVYLFMSLAIPGFRVKLEAAPDVVFLENLKIIWPFKAAVSLIAAALICCALSLLLRKQAPELTLALCAVVCALCFLTVLPFFSPVLAFVRRLEEITGLSQAVFAPLFKTAAIGLLSQLAGTLCRDSGQQALGQTIEICSGFLCIYLALPLLEMVLSLLQTMIGG